MDSPFLAHGGYRKLRSYKVAEAVYDATDKSDSPFCPLCGKRMLRRTARQGPKTGKSFWGCSQYPDCKGVRP